MKINSAELGSAPILKSAPGIIIHEKWKLLYAGIMVLFAVTCSYLLGSLFQSSSVVGLAVFALIFFIAGIIHVYGFREWVLSSKKHILGENLIYAVVFAMCIAFTAWIVSWSTQFQINQVWLVTGISFLLPTLIYETYSAYVSLPRHGYTAWFPPAINEPASKTSLLLNSTFFKINLLVKKADPRPTVFNVTLPKKLTISSVMSHFFYEHQKAIELKDDNKSFGWRFYVRKWYGLKMLDPERSLAENKIKEADVIYAQRVE